MRTALPAILTLTLSSCGILGSPSIDVPSVQRAVDEAVQVAKTAGMDSLKLEFTVEYSAKAGVDGTAFAIPVSASGESSRGNKATFELKTKAAIQAANISSPSYAQGEQMAKYNPRTHKITSYE